MANYLESLFSLEGKVAVVIGGTGELCGAMSEGLAGTGAQVVLVGRSADKAQRRVEAIQSSGGRASAVCADMTTRSALLGLLDTVLTSHGRIDIVVNGAGTNSATPFLQVTEEELDRIMHLNFRALYLSCQVFGEHLIAAGHGGSIINLGSMSGLTPLSRVFTYSASKAAVHNLSKNLAREWATHRVRVNTLVPGFFPAEQNRKILSPDRIQAIMGHTPMARFGEARELIGATLLLASEAAGSFITGHELVVDGGYAAMTI